MNDTQDPMLEMLREREAQLEKEYAQAHIEAERVVAIADARLSEVRELIERLTAKKRGRPRKVETVPAELMGLPVDPIAESVQ